MYVCIYISRQRNKCRREAWEVLLLLTTPRE
jgi:hypothetical protein